MVLNGLILALGPNCSQGGLAGDQILVVLSSGVASYVNIYSTKKESHDEFWIAINEA